LTNFDRHQRAIFQHCFHASHLSRNSWYCQSQWALDTILA